MSRPDNVPPFEALQREHWEGIAWWYEHGGKTTIEIGAQIQRHPKIVTKVLERQGVAMRSRGCRPTPPPTDAGLLNEVSLGVVRMLLAVNCSRRLRGAPTVHYVDLAAQVDEERGHVSSA